MKAMDGRKSHLWVISSVRARDRSSVVVGILDIAVFWAFSGAYIMGRASEDADVVDLPGVLEMWRTPLCRVSRFDSAVLACLQEEQTKPVDLDILGSGCVMFGRGKIPGREGETQSPRLISHDGEAMPP